MLSKFSVKRPYTVLVAVVLILVLGVVSFRDMNTDLLPKMDFPYAIVMTTYIGASPEEVEEQVTKPIEQAMASTSNIKNITSSSRENASVVMLEFDQSANMDSVTIEMRESLDTLTSNWDNDTISNPTIMKINPDMMPIMVAAVDFDDMESVDVTDKAKEEIIPELESIEGVASVTTSGEITQKVEVLIRQDKIDKMNQKVQDAIDGKLSDAEDKLADGEQKIKDGQSELDKQQNNAADKISQGETKLNEAATTVKDGLKTINEQITQVKAQEKTVTESETKVKEGLAAITAQKPTLQSTVTSLQTALTQMQTMQTVLADLDTKKINVEKQIETLGETTELKQQLETINGQIAAQEAALKAMGLTRETLAAKVSETQTGLTTAQTALTTLETQETTLNESKKQITTAKAKITAGLKKLDSTKKKLEKGQISTKKAMETLSKQKILTSIKLSVAQIQVSNGQTKIDDAKSQLDETKKTTKKNANLNTVISADMVKGLLTAENFEMPAGYVTEDNVDYLVKVGDKMDDTDQLENLVIADMGIDGLDPITLSDVADVVRTDDSAEVYAKINGNPGVVVVMEKQTGYSTGDVADRIQDKFASLESSTEGLHITTMMNQGIYIDLVVNSVLENLIYGGLLAIIILLLFLKDFKPTIIIACSIPLSLVTAIVLMYFSGVTLNIISLSGLALGVGMLVDNSVVVIENIYRLRKEGYSARKAAVEGAKEVAGAIAASTLTTVCVFAPIIFTEGITRQLFVDLGLTLAYSLLASLVIALTLIPALSAGILRRIKEDKPNSFLVKMQNFYGKILAKALKWKAIILVLALVLVGVSAWWATTNGTAFMPEMESTEMTVTMEANKDASFEEMTKMSDDAIEKISKIADVETVGAMTGGGGIMSSMGGGSSNSVSMYLILNEKRTLSNEEMKTQIEACFKGMNCEATVQTSTMDMSALGGSGISIEIKGKNLDKLQKVSEDIMKQIQDVKGVTDITNGLDETTEEYRITVDKEKAMEYSLTVAQVFQQINAKVKEATSATTISTDSKDYDVFVKKESEENFSRADVESMKIEYTDQTTQKTKKVKLSDIASFEKAVSPNTINRDNQSRQMTVSATLEDGYNIGLVSSDVKDALSKYTAPEGYSYEMKGEDESINESMGQLMLMILLGIIFMYLIMVAQFQSLLSPFIILFTIPLAFTGGFLGLAITGSEVSVIAMIGFVMLAGIIVNNGIVLVDYTNQLRRGGMEKKEAIVQAGRTRLRPILMTALTTILGLSTMAIGFGMGSDMVQPMAIVVIGGMIYGTLLTLFVVPCIYDIFNRKKDITEKEIN